MMKMTMSHSLPTGDRSFSETRLPVEPFVYDPADEPPVERWPVLVRLIVIVGLSLGLWAGIIWGVLAVF